MTWWRLTAGLNAKASLVGERRETQGVVVLSAHNQDALLSPSPYPSSLPAVQQLALALHSAFVPLADLGGSTALCRRGYGGEPVWFPWGSGPMGTTPVTRRGDTIATLWPDRAVLGPAGRGIGSLSRALRGLKPPVSWRGEGSPGSVSE